MEMRKQHWRKRMLAIVLTAVIGLSNVFPGMQQISKVEAASNYQNANRLANSDFEGSTEFGIINDSDMSRVGNWFSWNGSEKTQETSHSGTTAAKRLCIGAGCNRLSERYDLCV